MPTPTTIEIGQIWKTGNRTAVIVGFDPDYATVRDITDAGALTARSQRLWRADAGMPDTWTFTGQVPTLRCAGRAAATAVTAHLARNNVTVYQAGEHVIAPLTPPSVIRLADEALENDWAADPDCARMIGHLG